MVYIYKYRIERERWTRTLAMEKWSGRRCRRWICHDDEDDAVEKKGKVGGADEGMSTNQLERGDHI